jgi:putative spermidine/putrescine transport system permease protein
MHGLFGIPIALLLARAVYDPSIADALPRTSEALRNWDRAGLPGDPAFAALVADLKAKQANGGAADLAKSLNVRLPGARSQVLHAARQIHGADRGSALQAIKSSPFWSGPAT